MWNNVVWLIERVIDFGLLREMRGNVVDALLILVAWCFMTLVTSSIVWAIGYYPMKWVGLDTFATWWMWTSFSLTAAFIWVHLYTTHLIDAYERGRADQIAGNQRLKDYEESLEKVIQHQDQSPDPD